MECERRVIKSSLRVNTIYSKPVEIPCTFINVEPKSKLREESETTIDTEEELRVKRRAKKSVTFVPYIPKVCRDIPGCIRVNSVSSYFCSFGIKLKGHNYIRKKIAQYNSTVFRMNYFGPRIVVCDHEAMQFLFNGQIIQKQCRFGTISINKNITNGLMPFEFTNGVLHEHSCAFMMDHFKTIGRNCKTETLSKTIADEFLFMTSRVLETKDFEDVVGNCMSNIVTQTIIGARLDYFHIKNWYNHIVLSLSKRNSSGSNDDIRSSEQLLKQIEQSPIGVKLIKYGNIHNLDIKDISLELLPMLA